MTLALELTIRMVGAGLLGAAIGYEREMRAKGAGLRTHVLVALGACLFMIISQHGFSGAEKFDAARIAAGVVGGLGFLGGGIIMKTSNHVSGLTTAAGLWVTGAVGLSMGCGLYEMAVLCTALLLLCMEVLNFYSIRMGRNEFTLVFSAADEKSLKNAVESLGRQVKRFSLTQKDGSYKATLALVVRKRESYVHLLERITALPGVELLSLE